MDALLALTVMGFLLVTASIVALVAAGGRASTFVQHHVPRARAALQAFRWRFLASAVGYALGWLVTVILFVITHGIEAAPGKATPFMFGYWAIFGFAVGRWWAVVFPAVYPAGWQLRSELASELTTYYDAGVPDTPLELLIAGVSLVAAGWALRVLVSAWRRWDPDGARLG